MKLLVLLLFKFCQVWSCGFKCGHVFKPLMQIGQNGYSIPVFFYGKSFIAICFWLDWKAWIIISCQWSWCVLLLIYVFDLSFSLLPNLCLSCVLILLVTVRVYFKSFSVQNSNHTLSTTHDLFIISRVCVVVLCVAVHPSCLPGFCGRSSNLSCHTPASLTLARWHTFSQSWSLPHFLTPSFIHHLRLHNNHMSLALTACGMASVASCVH